MTNFSQIAIDMIAALGYGGIAVGLILDSAGAPIPSEAILPLAGALVKTGQFNMVLVVLVGAGAQTLGAMIAYWLGMGPGLAIIKRYGKYLLFREHELNKTHVLFEKYGAWLTLVGRCIPGIRSYIAIPAGVARMNFGVFVATTFIGSLLWSIFLTVLGYYLADYLHVIDGVVSSFGYVFAIIGGALFLWFVHHHTKKRRSARAAKEGSKRED